MNTQLKTLYEQINSKSIPDIQSELNGPTTYCKAIWSIGHWEHTPIFQELIKDLETLKYEGCVFTIDGEIAQLHWTLFQLQTFPVIVDTITLPNLMEEALRLKQIIYSSPHFSLDFVGISKSRFGLFLNGYPTADINKIRDRIRATFTGCVEPHPQDICHSTLFRFTKIPSQRSKIFMDYCVEKYKDKLLMKFVPNTWEFGYGSWLQKIRHVVHSWSAPPRWILHRGLCNGPDKSQENNETMIWKRIEEGWDIEIDIWLIDGVFMIGHDVPETRLVNYDLLINPHAWVHCKNLDALAAMPKNSHYFCHNEDPATLTSQNYIWCYPGNTVNHPKSVIVLPERAGFKFPLLLGASAVCSDFLPINLLE